MQQRPAYLALGQRGEDAALAWYARAGYRLLARNWRCPLGEIDLVVGSGRTVVFCEVKARRGGAFGGPHEAVGWRKQRKLRLLAEAFMSSRGLARSDVRFDVASVTVDGGGRLRVHVFEHAF